MMKKRKILFILILIISFSIFFPKNNQVGIINTTMPYITNNIPLIINEKVTNSKEQYEGILKIPKIHLSQEYYPQNSSLNDVNKGIEQLTNCKPNEDCMILLASHSGTSSISYFKNLEKLKVMDQAKIIYQEETYTYVLQKISYQEKIGFITIPKNTYDLVLTTCNTTNQNIQNIYLFKKI